MNNQSPPQFKEYRCTCGKLLFKGLLLLSVLEIKCKRCNTVRLIRELNGGIIGSTAFGMLLDGNGKIINICKNAPPILGWSIPELLTKNIIDINPSITIPFYQRLWQSRYDHADEYWHRKTFYHSKTGDIIPLLAQFKFLDVDGLHYFFIILNKQITDIRDADLDGSWFGEAPDEIIFEIDVSGLCTHISERNCESLGYAPSEIVGRPLSDFFPQLARTKEDARPLCVRNAGKPFDILNNAFTNHDGNAVLLDSYFVCNYSDGEFSGYRMFNWIKQVVTA